MHRERYLKGEAGWHKEPQCNAGFYIPTKRADKTSRPSLLQMHGHMQENFNIRETKYEQRRGMLDSFLKCCNDGVKSTMIGGCKEEETQNQRRPSVGFRNTTDMH